MNKQDALSVTVEKFTNLYGGGILPNVSVRTIIEYYEKLVDGKPVSVTYTPSGIENNFIEDAIGEMEDEYYMDQDNYPDL